RKIGSRAGIRPAIAVAKRCCSAGAPSALSLRSKRPDELRHELLAGIPASELRTCIKVLIRICEKAERRDEARRIVTSSVRLPQNGQNSDAFPNTKKRARRRVPRSSQ